MALQMREASGEWMVVLAAQPAGGDASLDPGATPLPQPVAPGGAVAPAPGQRQGSPMDSMLIFMLPALLIFMIFMTWRAGKAEKRKREELQSSIKKHDLVQTIGGVLGRVIEVRDHEIVLEVEEGRIRFVKSAIQSIVQPAAGRSQVEAKPELAAKT